MLDETEFLSRLRRARAVAASPATTRTCSSVGGTTLRRRLPARRVRHRAVRRQLQLARADLVAGQLPAHRVAAEVPPLLRRRLQGRVPDRLGRLRRRSTAVADELARRLVAALPARTQTAAGRSSATHAAACRPIRTSATTCCSTSTSTATPAAASAPRTRPAGPALVAKLLQPRRNPATREWLGLAERRAMIRPTGIRPEHGRARVAGGRRARRVRLGDRRGLARTRRYHALCWSPPRRRRGAASWSRGSRPSSRPGRGGSAAEHPALCPGDVLHPAADIAGSWRSRRAVAHLEHSGSRTAPRSCRIFAARGAPETVVRFAASSGEGLAASEVRPLSPAGRDHHADAPRERATSCSRPRSRRRVRSVFTPYPSDQAIVSLANGPYRRRPAGIVASYHTEEAARGLRGGPRIRRRPAMPHFEPLRRRRTLTLRARGSAARRSRPSGSLRRTAEAGAPRSPTPRSARAAERYLVRRGEGQTIIAGYPWFTDWGRDTFIALRGLLPRHRPTRRGRDDPGRSGPHRLRGHAAEPLPRSRAARPSSTRSTPRCGS